MVEAQGAEGCARTGGAKGTVGRRLGRKRGLVDMRAGKGTMKGHKKRKGNCKGKKKAKRKGREGESKGREGGGRR